MIIQLNENVLFEKTDTDSYFIDLNSGKYVYNNASSTAIIEQLLESSDIEEVIDDLLKIYIVDRDELKQDILEMIEELQRISLICESGE
ncbi:PqqD family protein [Paenibacillus sp. NPDC057886]|uniref:PqqD family protein n=1 Tax=Paenibacillus sp. NPDC057886 TaxID=3346270 RepID=UPI003691969B